MADCNNCFKDCDFDHNGEINKDEMKEWLKRYMNVDNKFKGKCGKDDGHKHGEIIPVDD
jgi:Ca2+-binding EF-hand superfamily protein